MHPNARVSELALSRTLALDARAKALAASGRDVVNLSVGEPDCDAPASVRAAARAAVDGGDVRYTPAAGRLSLRTAIARHLTNTRGVPFTAEEVTVCHSTKHALSGTVLALVDPGDEVLLLLPAWVSYFEIVRLAGGTPVAVAPRPDCGPDLEAVRAALTPRTKAVLVNTPSNPTGYVWTRAELQAFTALCLEHDLWMISDEIYRRLVYEGEPNPSPVSVSPEVRARTLIVDGASKAFAMTGYRIGYLAAPAPVAGAVARLQSQLTGSPNAISQAAFQAALEREPPEVEQMVQEFDARRRVLIQGLADLGLETPWPRGAFYAFPSVAEHVDERGSVGLCEDLLEDVALALVPGTVFGMDDHVRMSYATSIDNVRRALERLGDFLNRRGR